MRILLLTLFTLTFSLSNAQLVREHQKNPKRLDFIKAFEENRMVKMMGVKYRVLDVYYFFVDEERKSMDGGLYSEYKRAAIDGFVVNKDTSVNVIDFTFQNIKTKKTIIISFADAVSYNIDFLKRKVKQ